MNWNLKTLMSNNHKNILLEKTIPVFAVLMALIISAFIILMEGKDPILAFRYLLYGAVGNRKFIAETLAKTTPLLICSLGLAISFKANLTSIGAEGQMMIGGLFGTIAALYIPCPDNLRLLLVVAAGAAGGAAFGAIPGFLKAKFGISEIINTIMLNYIATYIVAYLLNGPMKDMKSGYQQSYMFPSSARMPIIVSGTRLHFGFIIAIALVFAYHILINKTPAGFKLRAVGSNREASRYAGIPVTRYIILALTLSGGMAGIAGAIEVSAMHGRLLNGFTSNVGFDAIAIALLGKLSPIGILISSLFFGALRVGSNSMQMGVQIPSALIDMIQGMIILFILCDKLILQIWTDRELNKQKKVLVEEAGKA